MFHRNKIVQFVGRTFHDLGYKTRFVLNNKSNEEACSNAIIRNKNGEILKEIDIINKFKNFDIIEESKLLQDLNYNDDYLIELSYVPTKFGFGKYVDVSYEELKSYNGSQDHYIEHYNDNGSFGVLYNIPPNINNPSYGARCTTLTQLPKIFKSENFNTLLILYNISSNEDYKTEANFIYKIFNRFGEIILKDNINILPNSYKTIDIENEFNLKNIINFDEFYYLEGISENATLIPLTLIYNKKSNMCSLEHSIPPIGYGDKIFGENKINIIKDNITIGQK